MNQHYEVCLASMQGTARDRRPQQTKAERIQWLRRRQEATAQWANGEAWQERQRELERLESEASR